MGIPTAIARQRRLNQIEKIRKKMMSQSSGKPSSPSPVTVAGTKKANALPKQKAPQTPESVPTPPKNEANTQKRTKPRQLKPQKLREKVRRKPLQRKTAGRPQTNTLGNYRNLQKLLNEVPDEPVNTPNVNGIKKVEPAGKPKMKSQTDEQPRRRSTADDQYDGTTAFELRERTLSEEAEADKIFDDGMY